MHSFKPKLKRGENGNRVIMKFIGMLVDILCELYPINRDYEVYRSGQKILFVHIMKGIYGLLMSAMLLHQNIKGDHANFGFDLSLCNPCVAKKRRIEVS